MIVIVILFLVGLFLSAFFSGSETGFYRVTRVRLMLDALGGDLMARSLLWLINNPALFVATALVGNNLANFLTSLAIVLAAQHLFQPHVGLAELVAPVVLSPVVFVYGELLPKNLYYHMPNRLLRRSGLLFLLFTVLFAPISAALWSLGRLLQQLVGEAPLQIKLQLARKELEQVLQEGQEAGILEPTQRYLAQSLSALASQPVADFATPPGRVAAVQQGVPRAEVLRLARRHGATVLPVREPQGRRLVGYVRILDLYLSPSQTLETVRPLVKIHYKQSYLTALTQMQHQQQELAAVVDDRGDTTGLLFAGELIAPLLRRER